MSEAEPALLVNAVSAYATVLAGLLALALAWLMTRQPWRWLFVYACVLVTGVATVWYHGFGEPFPARVADIGTNLLLAWAIVVAVIGDYYRTQTGRLLGFALGLLNLEYILTLAVSGGRTSTPLAVVFGQFGGFTLGELLLIANCVVAVGLLYARRSWIQPKARPILNIVTILFFVGMLFATAANTRIDYQIVAYHAVWHVVGAFGFIALWAFNEARFGWVEETDEAESLEAELEPDGLVREGLVEEVPTIETPRPARPVDESSERDRIFAY